MKREVFNEQLKKELAISVERNENTDKLKNLYNELATFLSETKRYLGLRNSMRKVMVSDAVIPCEEHGLKYNPEKSGDAFAYMSTIIRCSFARTTKREYNNKYRMTEERFQEFIHEVIPQQLFHVTPTDLDDESGARLDEVILVRLIAQNPSCLKYQKLQWFLDNFLISEEEWNKQMK